jgi:hypothetical protein
MCTDVDAHAYRHIGSCIQALRLLMRRAILIQLINPLVFSLATQLRVDKLPLASSLGKRVRLTCIDASLQYLALGSSTGSLYVYDRSSLKLKKLLALQFDGGGERTQEAITNVKIRPEGTMRDASVGSKRRGGGGVLSPDDHFAVVTERNVVYIVDGQVGNIKEKVRVLQKITIHQEKGAVVTAMLWDNTGRYGVYISMRAYFSSTA